MPAIATYMFIDLETTGLPQEENNKTKITEISLVTVKRQHILETRKGCAPRIQQKLTLCLNPGRMVHPECTKVTGLCNDLLEQEPFFDMKVFTILDTFINLFTKPVCLIAQNGHNFDFPILKSHLVKLGVSLADDLTCADCYYAFYDIMENLKKQKNSPSTFVSDNKEENSFNTENLWQNSHICEEKNVVSNDTSAQIVDLSDFYDDNTLSAQAINEKTPKKPIKNVSKTHKKIITPLTKSVACRRFPWSKGNKPTESYKLKDIYYRLLNEEAVDAHRAENDCLLALKSSVAIGEAFVQWVDENHCLFSEVKPMTVGVPLGR